MPWQEIRTPQSTIQRTEVTAEGSVAQVTPVRYIIATGASLVVATVHMRSESLVHRNRARLAALFARKRACHFAKEIKSTNRSVRRASVISARHARSRRVHGFLLGTHASIYLGKTSLKPPKPCLSEQDITICRDSFRCSSCSKLAKHCR